MSPDSLGLPEPLQRTMIGVRRELGDRMVPDLDRLSAQGRALSSTVTPIVFTSKPRNAKVGIANPQGD